MDSRSKALKNNWLGAVASMGSGLVKEWLVEALNCEVWLQSCPPLFPKVEACSLTANVNIGLRAASKVRPLIIIKISNHSLNTAPNDKPTFHPNAMLMIKHNMQQRAQVLDEDKQHTSAYPLPTQSIRAPVIAVQSHPAQPPRLAQAPSARQNPKDKVSKWKIGLVEDDGSVRVCSSLRL